MLQIKNETVNIWEYKVGNSDKIANFVCFWKTRIEQFKFDAFQGDKNNMTLLVQMYWNFKITRIKNIYQSKA